MNQPLIFKEKEYVVKDIDNFISEMNIEVICDIYEDQLDELYEIQNPSQIFNKKFDKQKKQFISSKLSTNPREQGDWVYFPWSKVLMHCVGEADLFALRVNRNQQIVTAEEQLLLRDFVVGIVGLSVGANIANALNYSGISNTIKIADFDTLATTNLNRVRARLDQVSASKASILSQQIYELNPHANVDVFEHGLNEGNVNDFINKGKRLDLIFEIIDDFKMKILLRKTAKECGVPVIMVTNLGDRILVDVERYDLEPNLNIFNGEIDNLDSDILKVKSITKEEEKLYAVNIVGKENIPTRVLETVHGIGNTNVGRPQVAWTALASSGIATFLAKKIALGQDVPSGRTLIDLDKIL